MARFERITMDSAEWGHVLSVFADRIVYQTPAWLSFLVETQKAELVIAALKEGNETVGYFTGLVLSKLGFRILASPYPGSSTPYMGFNLLPSVPRRVAAEALSAFAFKELRCAYVEVVDLRMTEADIVGLGFTYQMNPTMEIDLTQTEDQLLANMTKSCRWTVRKAEKNGVVIEEACDAGFAEDYAAQLGDVFAKQGMNPHIGADRVRVLIKYLHPTGALLMLRARDPEGHCVGTGIYPALNETAFYWGGASWRQYQKLYPNELLQWHAMRYWKRHGMKVYNMVGNMVFKQKFGGRETTVPCISKSKNALIACLRTRAPIMIRAGLRLAWKFKSLGSKPSSASPKNSVDS